MYCPELRSKRTPPSVWFNEQRICSNALSCCGDVHFEHENIETHLLLDGIPADLESLGLAASHGEAHYALKDLSPSARQNEVVCPMKSLNQSLSRRTNLLPTQS